MDQEVEKLIRQFLEHSSVSASAVSTVMDRLIEERPPLASRGPVRTGSRELARLIDHTALKPETAVADIVRLCEEAAEFGFASVCINPCYVRLAARMLQATDIAVCTVIGFPLGATTATAKAREAEQAVAHGAKEVDMVLNVGMLKSGVHDFVEADIRSVVDAVDDSALVKVILETALLSQREKVIACLLARSAGAHFVKTSTGISSGGATVEDVSLLRRVVGESIGVKASGGIRTASQAKSMIEAGATRIGASSSVAIVRGESAGSSEY